MSDGMLNEIVNRLREAAQVDEYYAVTMHRPLLIAIADAIEYLRGENQTLKEEKAYWRLMGRETGGY